VPAGGQRVPPGLARQQGLSQHRRRARTLRSRRCCGGACCRASSGGTRCPPAGTPRAPRRCCGNTCSRASPVCTRRLPAAVLLVARTTGLKAEQAKGINSPSSSSSLLHESASGRRAPAVQSCDIAFDARVALVGAGEGACLFVVKGCCVCCRCRCRFVYCSFSLCGLCYLCTGTQSTLRVPVSDVLCRWCFGSKRGLKGLKLKNEILTGAPRLWPCVGLLKKSENSEIPLKAQQT